MTYQVKKNCSVCGKPAIARSLCRNHYTQAHKRGELAQHQTVKPWEAFESRINKTETCWLWTGTKNGYGYGIFLLPGERAVRAHRYSYEHFTGIKVPSNKVVMHSCDNPLCVNPAHLSVATRLENNRDCATKGRRPFGTAHWATKLTEAERAEIRASNLPQSIIAARYGVSQSQISRIKTGKRQRLYRPK